MKITKRQLMNIIRESLVNEIGMGVGMGDSDLKHATTDPQNILAALSILPPAFVPVMVLSAILYYLDGKSEEAASTLALTALFGGGAQVISKIVPALRAGMKAAGGAKSGADEAVKASELAKAAEGVIKKNVIKPPKPHPKLTKKQTSNYDLTIAETFGTPNEPFIGITSEMKAADDVFRAFRKNADPKDFAYVIDARGVTYRILPKRFYDKLGSDASLREILKDVMPYGKSGDTIKIYDGIPTQDGAILQKLKLASDLK